jgi:dTDP-4-amino-4,6-dideoxygalactose transaminase
LQLIETAPDASSSYHLIVVQTPYRDDLRRALAAEQISTGLHYPIPCHRQTAFKTDGRTALPIVEAAAGRILSLPMFPHLTDAQVECVADAIFRALPRAVCQEAFQVRHAENATP